MHQGGARRSSLTSINPTKSTTRRKPKEHQVGTCYPTQLGQGLAVLKCASTSFKIEAYQSNPTPKYPSTRKSYRRIKWYIFLSIPERCYANSS
jgi:hypothetical protein